MTVDTPPLVIAVCCREWPVSPFDPIGRCGFCGERPVIDWTIDIAEGWTTIGWTTEDWNDK